MPKKTKITCVEVDGGYHNPVPLYSVDLTAAEIRGLKALPSVGYAMSSLRGDESPLMGPGFSWSVNDFCTHLEKKLPKLGDGLGYRLCNQPEKRGDLRGLIHSNQGLFRRLFGILRTAIHFPEAALVEMEAADSAEEKEVARQAAAQQAAARQAAAQQAAARQAAAQQAAARQAAAQQAAAQQAAARQAAAQQAAAQQAAAQQAAEQKAAEQKAAEQKAAEQEAAEQEAAEQKAAEQEAAEQEAAEQKAVEKPPVDSEVFKQSLKSLELILKYGLDELRDETSEISKLIDPSITPAMRLFIFDLIYIMAAHFPKLSYNRHATPGEEALHSIQQLALSEDKYHAPLIRMAENVNQAGVLRPNQASETVDTDFSLDNPALEVADQALSYLREKASTFTGKHSGFFTHATEENASNQTKSADLKSAAAEIEAHAGEIEHLNLPPAVLEKLQTKKQLNDEVTAQPTLFN